MLLNPNTLLLVMSAGPPCLGSGKVYPAFTPNDYKSHITVIGIQFWERKLTLAYSTWKEILKVVQSLPSLDLRDFPLNKPPSRWNTTVVSFWCGLFLTLPFYDSIFRLTRSFVVKSPIQVWWWFTSGIRSHQLINFSICCIFFTKQPLPLEPKVNCLAIKRLVSASNQTGCKNHIKTTVIYQLVKCRSMQYSQNTVSS